MKFYNPMMAAYNSDYERRLLAKSFLSSKKDCGMFDRDYQEIRIIEFILEALSHYL